MNTIILIPLENTKSKIKIYPIPSTSLVTIELRGSQNEIQGIELYDIFGKAFTKSIPIIKKGFMNIDLTNLASGVYFLRLIYAEHSKTFKIIRQ